MPNWERQNSRIQNGARTRRPKIDQKENGAMEIEYRERKRQIIDPLPNDWIVSYTKPLIELQRQPNHRYKSICDRVASTGADSNQILSTLRNELEIYRYDTVSIIHDGLREAMGSGRSNELGGEVLSLLKRTMAFGASCLFRKREAKTTGRSAIERSVGWGANPRIID